MGIEVAPILSIFLCLMGDKYKVAYRETMIIGLMATLIS